jgi:hypothetical protein
VPDLRRSTREWPVEKARPADESDQIGFASNAAQAQQTRQ